MKRRIEVLGDDDTDEEEKVSYKPVDVVNVADEHKYDLDTKDTFHS